MAPRRPFTDAEFTIINDFGDSRTRTLLICGALTGFRISELLSWKNSDLFENGIIRNTITVKAEYMKNKKNSRTVIIHDVIKVLLTTGLAD